MKKKYASNEHELFSLDKYILFYPVMKIANWSFLQRSTLKHKLTQLRVDGKRNMSLLISFYNQLLGRPTSYPIPDRSSMTPLVKVAKCYHERSINPSSHAIHWEEQYEMILKGRLVPDYNGPE